MKFSKILPLSLLAAFTLAGCSESGAAFKNLEADKILDQGEAAIVFAKAEIASFAVSNIDIKMSTKAQDALSSREMTMSGSQVFYKDGGYKSTRTTKDKTVEDGLTVEQESTSNEYCGKLDAKRYFRVIETTGPQASYDEALLDIEDGNLIKKEEVANLMSSVEHLASNVARRKDGTYYFFETSLSDEYIPYEFGNNITLQEHRIQKAQAVAELNADFSVKSFEMTVTRESNIDPSTHQVYEQPKLVAEQSAVYTISYNALAEAGEEITSKATMINDKPQLAAAALMVTGYTYDKDSKALTKVGEGDFGGTLRRLGHDTYHYSLYSEVDPDGFNAFSFAFAYSTFTAKLEPGTIEETLLPTQGVANDLNGLELVDAAKGAFYNKGELKSLRFVIEFDIVLVDAKAQLSNVTYIVA